MKQFKKLSHVVWDCKYRVVWCPKYRFRILKGDVAKSVRAIIRQLCEWKKIEILAGNVFPFKVSEGGGIFLYKTSFSLPDQPDVTTTLIKNRRYVGDTSYMFKDKKRACIAFEVKELVEIDDQKAGGIEPQWEGKEIYAENIGLIFYEKKLGNSPLAYALYDRYPMTVLEEKFKQMMSSDNTYEQN